MHFVFLGILQSDNIIRVFVEELKWRGMVGGGEGVGVAGALLSIYAAMYDHFIQ